ncbi:NACHT domain-containing NTPase [Trichocoleus sp. DQ-A3]|uniref:NACHT domain-containing protein n=1 Tax=Cyanophyceae TaxID=3028117 RepID=UPI001688D9F6|nr:NACHT domain-containing NTPase [Coleofasciculus sp. FACHB-125]MBD1899843.1 NACHT domain-containing NTPase [Coleofasciculus sp. FACHB-125]
MAVRSLQVSPEAIQTAQDALTDRCLTQKELAKELSFSRETVGKFFRGQPVDRQYFVKICEELRLEWDEIAAQPRSKPTPEEQKQDTSEIDALVQKVRSLRRQKIRDQCGTMRMLDISQAIALTDIYTEVNILEEILCQQWREISDLLQEFNPESDDFDRPGLGKRLKRVPGMNAVSRYSKLMILGKPGAGKTTFLQWIAIKCDLGEFQPHRIPIFIRLKNFAKDTRGESDFKLFNYIKKEFRTCGIADESVTEIVLTQGRALILLDGLDEVSKADDDEVVDQIRKFYETYFQNQFIITCRIAAGKYRFQQENFIDVEVANFEKEQVKAFARKWFVAVARNNREEGEARAREFNETLNLPKNNRIQKLAVTPILLNLTCFVFLEKREFPSKRSKLYEQGLDILLVRWDESQKIKRDEVYRNLSLYHKIELVSQVALITFYDSCYFFEKCDIERHIADYLCTLPNSQTDRATLQRDSQAVLKAIEAQHGLLVERARGIYSFSHLTFQEYFTAKKIVDGGDWQDLVSHINEYRWREVFLLVAEMLPNADNLLRLMKQRTDAIVGDEKLQDFLMWVSKKSSSVQASYKLAAIRDSYLYSACALNFGRSYVNPSLRNTFGYANILSLAYVLDRKSTNDVGDELHLDRQLDGVLSSALDMVEDSTFEYIFDAEFDFTDRIDDTIDLAENCKLQQPLQQLKAQLPNSKEDRQRFKDWWQANGHAWTDKLRAAMIEYRNIGHNLQFSNQQKELLQQYYNANNFLVACLNSGCEVTIAVRQEIEDTLLLPIAQIEKYRQSIL